MALNTVTRAIIDDNINTNGIQYITGAINNDVLNEMMTALEVAEVYVNPATTDNPGTPANNRAYIALPGIYTNFGGLEITAPLGILKWDGTSWSVTQLWLPSPYDYKKCKLNTALTGGTPYTTFNVTMMDGGVDAVAGEWVQIINRRTGERDFVQLTANVADTDTSITFKLWTMANSHPVGSIIDFRPCTNMQWKSRTLYGDGTNDYIDIPTTPEVLWLPPVECVDENVWASMVQVIINGIVAAWVPSPAGDTEYDVNASSRIRLEFSRIMTPFDRVVVRVNHPQIATP